jgi:hypothetical protein
MRNFFPDITYIYINLSQIKEEEKEEEEESTITS